MSSTPKQEALAFKIDDSGSFDTYVVGQNKLLLDSLINAVVSKRHEFFYIFGPTGSGKSHLLTAFYRSVKMQVSDAYYLDLNIVANLGTEPFYYNSSLLNVLDNVEAVAGNDDLELGLFSFYNRWLDHKRGVLVASATVTADSIAFNRKDLNTRMQSGVSFNVKPLSDNDCAKALILRANKRGFDMPKNVAHFLVKHCNRNMTNLVAILDKLDEASMQEQHFLTIPFIKKILKI